MAGFKYESISAAAEKAAISQRWLHLLVRENSGGPVTAKNQFIVTDSWVRERVPARGGEA
jgi:hypothetical protein